MIGKSLLDTIVPASEKARTNLESLVQSLTATPDSLYDMEGHGRHKDSQQQRGTMKPIQGSKRSRLGSAPMLVCQLLAGQSGLKR